MQISKAAAMGNVQAGHRPLVAPRSVTPGARYVPLIGLVLASAFALPSAAQAETTVAVEQAPTAVNSFRGRLVWSSFDPASGEFSLKLLRHGHVRKLGVRTRKAP